jgi:hypothetical protein
MSSFLVSVIVNEREFVIQKMSAQQQYDVFEIFSEHGLEQALFSMATGDNHLIAAGFFGSFAKTASRATKAQITEMLLGMCMEKGSKKPISIDDFQDQIYTYIMLHIEALKVNYADFMPLLQPAQEQEEDMNEQGMSPL